jgi:hypothetical protein
MKGNEGCWEGTCVAVVGCNERGSLPEVSDNVGRFAQGRGEEPPDVKRESVPPKLEGDIGRSGRVTISPLELAPSRGPESG